ncbi:MAG: glycosyltransferase family 39 protein [Lachnospiraceae bacterium]|nr:glycosyltransferase family 39 protein [Lachnospiraceae bacterium]
MERKKVSIRKLIFAVMFLLLTAWTCVLCFYHLGEAGTHNWDEAIYGINAYEMIQSGNWWIQTYRYAVDYYNLKPPFIMWCIALCFQSLGFSFFAMRLPSAIAAVLLFGLISLFTARHFGKKAAIIAGIVFVSCTDMIFFHMARSADADALYLLMFMAAMACLYESEKRPWLFTGCGVFLSLAFMAKCMHMGIGVVVVILYLPRIYKKLKVKHYICAAIGAAIPTGIWAAVRFSYDGFAFFAQMFGIEIVDRVTKESDYLGYIRYFGTKPVVLLSLSAVVVALVLLFLQKKEEEKAEKTKSLFGRVTGSKLYLFVLWLLVSLGAYSASGSFMEWYGYICYLPFCIITGAVLAKACDLSGKKKAAALILLLLPVIGFGISVKKSLWNLQTLDYENNTDIRRDISSLIEKYPEYRGARIYIENSRNEYCRQNEWEQNSVADIYIIGDLEPIEGGVPVFVEDKDALLLISKNLFETYSNVLAGRVILVDGDDYLIFSNDFYG